MRLAIILGTPHGGGAPVILSGPEVPFPEARARWKEIKGTRENADFEAVRFYELTNETAGTKRFAAPAVPSPFEELTVPELKDRCDELGIDHTGFRLKQEYVDALDLDEQLSAKTIAQLRAEAIAQGISTAGFRRKRDYLVALEAAAREKEKATEFTPHAPAEPAPDAAEDSPSAAQSESPLPPEFGPAAEAGKEEPQGPSLDLSEPTAGSARRRR